MKLLFDENLSPRLVHLLVDVFPDSESILRANLGGSSDTDVWTFAATMSYIIVSKDSDFVDRAIASSAVRVLWIRLGNCTTEALHLVLRNSRDRINSFVQSEDSVLELP